MSIESSGYNEHGLFNVFLAPAELVKQIRSRRKRARVPRTSYLSKVSSSPEVGIGSVVPSRSSIG